ncbi:rhamnogalacturonan acetylesterase [Salegentibacter sp. LM13S]|uniref:rhamnogalacturonan acetylesterase n=1 Tax=Salegentibacter lacus TaxID=2873599 RepID=UPI001CCD5729|nr:rhamnogalacturonan acetylesterase [Salegentibacter lacus]MBZ9630044.1 rhamnogalacturonan acetylesterase [Salegentibacter lacus]
MKIFNPYILLICFGLVHISLQAQEPTLYLIGDSTMSNKKDPEENPEHGWGQVLPELLTNKIKVENHAVNGRSTKSFIDEGRWEKVLEKLQPGDFVFIQFGHNDQKFKAPSRFTNPFTGYRSNLEKFVNETLEKGATPILFSSIVRRNFNEHGTLVDTHGEYPLVVRLVAEDLKVPFVDLQRATEELLLSYGEEDSKNLHLHFAPGENDYYPDGKTDDTHLSKEGATLVASLALKELAKLDSEFKSFIKESVLQKKISGHNK